MSEVQKPTSAAEGKLHEREHISYRPRFWSVGFFGAFFDRQVEHNHFNEIVEQGRNRRQLCERIVEGDERIEHSQKQIHVVVTSKLDVSSSVGATTGTESCAMAKKIFDDRTIEGWEIELENNRPCLLTEMDFSAIPEIVSFAPSALNVGLCFRLRARDGREFAFFANPVVAQNMAGTIFAVGLEAGWLNWHGNVVPPLLSNLDS